MFDELDKNSIITANAKSQAPIGNPQVQGAAVKTEDIFAGVDKPQKPEAFRPKADAKEPRGAAGQAAPGWKSNKILVFSLLFGGLAIIIAGGYFGMKLAFKPKAEITNSALDARVIENNKENPLSEVNVNEPAIEQTQNQPIQAETAPPADTDADGLADDAETALGTDINSPDTDNDGLSDREEAKVYNTNPLVKDTDGDGYNDGQEVTNGYNPKGSGKLLEIK